MSEEVNNKVAIQTLFQKLTELLLSSAKTRVDVTDSIVMVGNWVAIVFASLIVMLEGNDTHKASSSIDRITSALNVEAKKHVTMIRGIKKKAEKSPIIT